MSFGKTPTPMIMPMGATPPPPPPVIGQAPATKKPKAKSSTPSFLGAESSPDSTSVSSKTLLGQ